VSADAPRGSGLRVENVSKTFPGTRALDRVSFTAARGEVLALLGANGSGKSTVIKILAGLHQPDPGARGWVDDEELELGSAEDAKRAGLRFVHQDLGLIAELNAVDNIALSLGYLKIRGGIRQAEQIARTEEIIGSLGLDLDVTRPLLEASPVERTCIAIARALWDQDQGPRILVLDEPTASLPPREVNRLFEAIAGVRSAGHAVVYVSHRMDEIFQISQSAVVLRGGGIVAAGPTADLSMERLTNLIVGRSEDEEEDVVATRRRPAEGERLRVEGLRGRYVRGIDLVLTDGEILGVAGLLGSGRDELPFLAAGAVAAEPGARWWIDGRRAAAPTPERAPKAGIAFVPPDRGAEGLIAAMSVRENLTLSSLPASRVRGALSARRNRAQTREWLRRVGVAEETAERPMTTLSGGNQQRVLLARCLALAPRILIVSEPTAGVDVGARRALYDLLEEQAAAGLSVLLASSDTEDLVSVCHRVLLFRAGEVVGEFEGAQIEAERLLAGMEG
jgi:ribose transport system ATP-binding protein